jgi:hypothetical protein
MKLVEQSVVVHVSDEGRRILREVGVQLPDTPGVRFEVEEESNYGLWVALDYEDGSRHAILIRWEYVLSMDVIVGEVQAGGPVN